MRKMAKNGYTLTEILMVVIILAILASMTLPRLASQTEKANVSEGAGILGAIRQGEMAYRLDTGSYLSPASDADWAKLGLDNPNTGTPKFTYSVDGAGTGTATRAADAGSYAGKTVTLTITGTWGGDHPNVPSN